MAVFWGVVVFVAVWAVARRGAGAPRAPRAAPDVTEVHATTAGDRDA